MQLGAAPACDPPTAVTATSTGTTTATVGFTAVAGNTGYQVVYGPAGFNPSSGGTTITTTTSPVMLTGLSPATTYNVYVRSNCTSGGNSLFTAVATFVTNCDATAPITAFPYNQNFDTILPGQALPCGITVLDANNDGVTWAITKTTPSSSPNVLRYTSAIRNSVAANDWFFSPALTTAANTRYQVAFRYRGEGITGSPSNYTEKLEVKVGASATPAGQITTLYTNTAITNTSYALANATSTPAVAVFTPGAGTQYVGFHVFSDANQGNLYIDDLSITASVVTATSSAALLRAVTVFPNPSATGLFDLEIHGAQAKSSLGVLVTNTLGQQVYVGTARDNYTNRLDLSGLAPGLYHLQVRNGDETMTRQLAIVK
ncbi:T9SS type A sorting domain-containing protein [Hymenobacter sp. BRD128]|uniref:T9SS type A sorting domain-containing protein n=1 Tax=Hymenobacter sp. BRD128 TaxID=2675878 RepID=UPI0015635AFB|nr:T9SS type A sorting domain-containing protein [Hymenobacter sp. BRD128]QKG57567.1 T9SS type A sorting domain-containing protein [Hymenobacter sp. BRD128]